MAGGFRELGFFAPFGALWLAADGNDPPDEAGRYMLFPSQRVSQGAEEEIFIQGNRIVWSCAQTVVKSFTLPARIVQALWCSFPGDAEKAGANKHTAAWSGDSSSSGPSKLPSLCILMEREVAIYAPDGATFSVSLPFIAQDMWQMGELLLLRASERNIGASSPSTSSPSLFTLSHPLDEPRPVLVASPPAAAESFQPITAAGLSVQVEPLAGALHNPNLKVKLVASGLEPELGGAWGAGFLIGFDQGTGEHCMWDLASTGGEGWGGFGVSKSNREEGDATAFIYSNAHGWCACGSVGLGAVSRDEWYDARGDFTLAPTWASKVPASEASKVFLASSLGTSHPLCVLVCPPHVHLLPVLPPGGGGLGTATPGGMVVAVDASPLVEFSGEEAFTCVAVLTPTGGLSVYLGGSFLREVTLQSVPRGLGASGGLCHAVGGRVSVGGEGGVRVEMCTVGSLLVRRTLVQVRNNLRLATYIRVRRSLLDQTTSDSPGDEWDALATVLQGLIFDSGLRPPFSATPPPIPSMPTEPPSDAFAAMLSSSHHTKLLASNALPSLLTKSLPRAPPSILPPSPPPPAGEAWGLPAKERQGEVHNLMLSLHCLYEDMKLQVAMHSEMPKLARLVLVLAASLKAPAFVDYYVRHHPDLATLGVVEGGAGGGGERVPDIYQWVCERLEGNCPPVSELEDPSKRLLPATEQICAIFCSLCGDVTNTSFSPSKTTAAAPSNLNHPSDRLSPVPNLLTSAQLMRQASGMSSLSMSSSDPPPDARRRHGMDAGAMSRQSSILSQERMVISEDGLFANPCEALVDCMVSLGLRRHYIDALPLGMALPIREALWACRKNPPQRWGPKHFCLIGREDLNTPIGPRAIRVSGAETETGGDGGVEIGGRGGGQRGGAGTGGATEEGVGGGDVSNADGTRMDGEFDRLRFGRDRRLIEVRRCLSASIAVRLRIPPSSEVTDYDVHAAHQARLQLLARRTLALSVGRGIFTLATATPLPTEALPIPPLQLGGRLPSNDAFIKLDLTQLPADHAAWPEFHNGVASALRLALGQTAISRTWIVYNKPEAASFSHAGVLMGLGLQGHLKALAKTDLYSYLCQDHEVTQIGIMLGMAASKRSTMEEEVFKMLYVHIPSLHPPNYPDLEVSSVVQTAAVLGIGLLYQGSKHRRITEVLLSEIGRRATNDRLQDREGYSLAAGLALGLVTLGQGNNAPGLGDLQIENQLRRYMIGGRDASLTAVAAPDPTVCCRIKEGDNVNVDVTAPGATLALGLMFMRTNSRSVAARLDVPDTNFTLQYVRPDLVLLRMLARSLIMWDEIEPTKEWVESRMPGIVREAALSKASSATQEGASDSDNAGAGASLFADQDTLRHLHANIVAGCCMAIGLRFAGSGEKRALDLLMGHISQFASLRRLSCDGARKVDRQLMENCLCVVAISASLVMAGTGNVDLLRVLRKLRERVEPELHYGHHMAIGIAIGFLFLGGGRATLCTSNEAIAALVIALYPRFPISTTDCRYHLQAFRHLFVLAVEQRCLETVDVVTRLPCMVPVEITLREGEKHAETVIKRVTPCLLPELELVKSVQVCSPRHWPVTWDVESDKKLSKALRKGCVVHVQRKIGHLSYSDDPSGLRNLLVRSFPKHGRGKDTAEHQRQDKTEFVQSFSGDPAVIAFAKYMCTPQPVQTKSLPNKSDAADQAHFTEFCTGVLYECLTSEKPEMLAVYASLFNAARDMEERPTWQLVCDLRLVLTYYGLLSPRPYPLKGPSPFVREPLLSESFLTKLRSKVDQVFRDHSLCAGAGAASPLTAYTASGTFPVSPREARHLASLLLFYGVPSPLRLRRACTDLAQLLGGVPGGLAGAAPLTAMVMRDVAPGTTMLLAPHMAAASVEMA